MKRSDVQELHYITPIENVPSIMEYGILSFRRATKISHLSVAMSEIQERRERISVPRGRRLHEYANLYFNARNPMLFLRVQEGLHDSLCVLRVNPTVLDLPNVVIADGNAAAGTTAFWASPDGLARIDKLRLFAQYWTDPDPYVQREKKRAIMAEVLVPDRVAPEFVIGACVSCRAASRAPVLTGRDITTTIEEHMFFLSRGEGSQGMVDVRVGDLFQSKAQTLVNTVNCVGVMGKGIALEFKKRFPEMYEDYVARCARGEVHLGQPYLYKHATPPWVLNFPTKDHWRSVAKLDDIVRGLEFVIAHYREWGITSFAVPPLGCGNGQLEWRVVGPTLHHYLNKIDVPVELYAPYGTPHEQLAPGFFQRSLPLAMDHGSMPEPEWIPPAWVAIVEIIRRIEEQPYHWPIGRTIFQKIAYIATSQGLPTQLSFERNSYGPHSSQLKQLESRLVNNGLIRAEPRGKMVAIEVGPTFPDARRAYHTDLEQWGDVIARTADLFMRMTGRQAEVVSTVLFTAQSLAAAECITPTERTVVDAVMEWKQRRQPPFDEGEVAVTIRDLAALGWLNVRPSEDMPLPEDDVLLYA